jgi:hypothetical protein
MIWHSGIDLYNPIALPNPHPMFSSASHIHISGGHFTTIPESLFSEKDIVQMYCSRTSSPLENEDIVHSSTRVCCESPGTYELDIIVGVACFDITLFNRKTQSYEFPFSAASKNTQTIRKSRSNLPKLLLFDGSSCADPVYRV